MCVHTVPHYYSMVGSRSVEYVVHSIITQFRIPPNAAGIVMMPTFTAAVIVALCTLAYVSIVSYRLGEPVVQGILTQSRILPTAAGFCPAHF